MPLVVILGYSVYIDGLYLVPIGKRKQSAAAVCVGACSNVILNTILILLFKSFGAALATLMTEIIVASIMAYIAGNAVEWKKQIGYIVRYLLCALVMLLCVKSFGKIIGINSEIATLLLQICVGGLIYFFMLLIIQDNVAFSIIEELKRVISHTPEDLK